MGWKDGERGDHRFGGLTNVEDYNEAATITLANICKTGDKWVGTSESGQSINIGRDLVEEDNHTTNDFVLKMRLEQALGVSTESLTLWHGEKQWEIGEAEVDSLTVKASQQELMIRVYDSIKSNVPAHEFIFKPNGPDFFSSYL